jgi:hypothetical protein
MLIIFFLVVARASVLISAILPNVARLLSQHGRGLYVKPLYASLARLDRDLAVRTHRQNQTYYHTVINNYLTQLLA